MLCQHGFQFPYLAVKGYCGLKRLEDAAAGDWGFERVGSPARISVIVRMNGIVRIGVMARIVVMARISVIFWMGVR